MICFRCGHYINPDQEMARAQRSDDCPCACHKAGHKEDEFTDYDRKMLKVLDDLAKIRSTLTDYGIWLCEEWLDASDEQPPFFEAHEQPNGNGESRCTFVFVLAEITIPTKEIADNEVP